jgi:hypothetical protein
MSRAICEACSSPQPVDWKSGDLCTQCGQPARREVRCFWCAKWTPSGKYCRRCGAAVLDEPLYGAARMLREAGTDRFTIPKLIVELDPEQVDNFSRMYQRHEAALHLHVEHVRFLERFLVRKGFGDALEEELTPQLPWPDETFEKLSQSANQIGSLVQGPRTRDQNLKTSRKLEEHSPFLTTRSLALLVRLRLDDWTAQREAGNLLFASDTALRNEAVLALTGWRVVYGTGIEEHYRELKLALRDSPFRLHAALRLGMLGEPDEAMIRDALLSSDREVRLMAALSGSDRDSLAALLSSEDSLERFAAGRRLVELDYADGLGDLLLSASADEQTKLLKAIARRAKPVPEMREACYRILSDTGDAQLRRAAVSVLCLGCPPGEVERMAGTAGGDATLVQIILQRAELPPEGLNRLGAWLLDHADFRTEQYGMNDIAKQGRMPPDFVPRHWDGAGDPLRRELCRFAEMQLDNYADEALLRFLVSLAFQSGSSVAVRTDVWRSLYRLQRRVDLSAKSPVVIRMDSVERFFGNLENFLDTFTAFLQDPLLPALVQENAPGDALKHLLRYPESDVTEYLPSHVRRVTDLANVISQIARNRADFDFLLRIECVRFLGWLGRISRFEADMRERIATCRGIDVDHACNTAIDWIAAH